jgi:hypothetical protein
LEALKQMALLMPDLRAEAIAEARRLAEMRTIEREGDAAALARSDGAGPLITRVRRNTLRRQLAGRILLIWRVSWEDGAGRIAESHIVALLVDVEAAPSNVHRRTWIRAMLRDADASLNHHVEASGLIWRETVATVAGRFAAAQIRRAHAITERLADEPPREYQAGLFDRRAERARRAAANDSTGRRQHARARVTAAALAARLTARPGELLLVLTP